MSALLHGHRVATAPAGLVGTEPFAAWAAERVAPLFPPAQPPERAGLFVATSDAGAAAAIGLWAEALAQGPGFASPRDFPWTLASSPAGHIAARLPLRGPTCTLMGGGEATSAALWHALVALEEAQIDLALVVALDLSPALHPDGGRAALAALSLRAATDEAAGWRLEFARGPGTAIPGTFAVPLLATLCRARDHGTPCVVGHPDEGWFALRPV